MRKSVAVMLVLVFSSALLIVAANPAGATATENSWETKTPMPQAVSGVKAAVVNGKIYVMASTFNYEYDPATDNWTAKKPMPTPRGFRFGIATCQNKIYVIGGGNWTNGYTNYLSTNEVYDPLTDTWETKKPMPTSRDELSANVVNGKIYLIGGVADNSISPVTSVNEVYDPATDSWTTKQPVPIGVVNYASAVIDNKIYIMGGGASSNETLNGISNQIYDAETDTWSFGASLPTFTYYAAAGATTGVMAPKRIYVMGGEPFFTEITDVVNVYDPALDAWSSGAPLPTNRTGHAVAVVNDVIYAIGGGFDYQGDPPLGWSLTNVVEQYTPFGYGTIPQLEPDPQPESFPTTLVAAASVATIAVIGVGLLVYFKKRKKVGG
jgi:N-acetylneuraminic acid mutarotase